MFKVANYPKGGSCLHTQIMLFSPQNPRAKHCTQRIFEKVFLRVCYMESRPTKAAGDGELLFCRGKANHITCSQPLYTSAPFIPLRQRKNAACEKYVRHFISTYDAHMILGNAFSSFAISPLITFLRVHSMREE